MPHYTAPIWDMQFILHDVLQISAQDIAGYSDLDPAFTEAILGQAGAIASEILAPLNAIGDREGCTLHNGRVRTPSGFAAAFDAIKQGGWMGLDCDPAYGGQGLTYLMGTAVGEMFTSANLALNMYQGLTHGAYSAILAHGTDAQKAAFLPNLVSGRWTATMNLTEAHCGTDLGLMRTRAHPMEDGSYRITGEKIFISSGDHDLAENIIHLVLAKAPGGGDGIKGVSLFIVPAVMPLPDGNLGARNAVSVGKLEHKMGIRGSATCVMNYGGAVGYLLGDMHKGMRAMFTMMNEARIGVGLQGYAVAEAAYQASLDYAKNRLQGRAATGAVNPSGPADPLLVHPDIRRNLMEQRAFIQGARALTYWGATLIDRAARGSDKQGGDAQAEALISLLTPVIKGFQTDKGFEMAVQAQQIWGGHGYIEDNGAAQFVRDARIAQIYEGANGIQALDLVGRKLGADGGRAIKALAQMMTEFMAAHGADARMTQLLGGLQRALGDVQTAAMYFMQQGARNPNAVLAGAYDFMHLLGHTCLGFMWARMAAAALAGIDQGRSDTAALQAKVKTAQFYMARCMPATALHLARIQTGADVVMSLQDADF
jgi:alkylation response protein AidB-like acyl-CoA dehydrogenase